MHANGCRLTVQEQTTNQLLLHIAIHGLLFIDVTKCIEPFTPLYYLMCSINQLQAEDDCKQLITASPQK